MTLIIGITCLFILTIGVTDGIAAVTFADYLVGANHHGEEASEMVSEASEEKCRLPTSNATKYSLVPCFPDDPCPGLPADSVIDSNSTIFLYCHENYTLIGSNNYKVCRNGKWLPEDKSPSCVRTCEPLVTTSRVNTLCTFEGRIVSCTNRVAAGTVATSTLKGKIINRDFKSYNNTCLSHGEWKDSPEVIGVLSLDLCGVLKPHRTLIQDGKEANAIYHPWNVALYEINKNNFTFICGGTLISNSAVLTAATCANHFDRIVYPHKLKVGLGKIFRDYEHPSDVDAQYISVRNIYKPTLFDKAATCLVFDLAILELNSEAELSDVIMPACIDSNNEFFLTNHSVGSVAGWGFYSIGENSELAYSLMKAELPYVNRSSCIKYGKDVLKFSKMENKLTKDKFCAFHSEDHKPTIRHGDGGAGITFEFKGRHYVSGILSLQIENKINIFTNVTHPEHLEFINKIMDQIIDNNAINIEKTEKNLDQ